MWCVHVVRVVCVCVACVWVVTLWCGVGVLGVVGGGSESESQQVMGHRATCIQSGRKL